MGIKEFIETKMAIGFIRKTDPVLLATRLADIADHLIDVELGEKGSEFVQQEAVPWIDRFCIAFNNQLLQDQKKKEE